jgi:TolB-like protein
MKHNPFFKLLCTVILSLYGIAAAQAGQVITKDDREWARQALQQEAHLGAIDSSNSVAILNFHNKTGQKRLNALQKGLALMLITDLSKIEHLFVIERIKIQALVDEMNFGETGLVDPGSAPKVGRFLKAYYVVNGDINEGSIEELGISSSVLDVPFENITDLEDAQGNLDQLFQLEKEILFGIIDELKITVSPEKKKELMKPLSYSSAALLALFLGIDHSDKGEYAEAAKMYDRALVEDPDLQIARDSLQELKDMGLSADEDVSRLEAEAEAPPAEGGAGWGTVVLVGLGVAAVAGGAYALSSSSSDDDSGGGTTPDPTEPEALTVSSNTESANCETGSAVFTFSQPVDRASGTITTTPTLDSLMPLSWSSDNRVVTVAWKSEYEALCYSIPEPLVVNINDFRSLGSDPQTLSGETRFEIPVNYSTSE